MKKTNPKRLRLGGQITTILGGMFLVYWAHPIVQSHETAELSNLLVISIGIPL